MRHLIHVTRTTSGTRELSVDGASTLVRYHALLREIPDELEEAEEHGDGVDHRRDELFLASEVAHAGDPEVVIALGFAIGACASYARQNGATIEALIELDDAGLDEEQRAKLQWLLDSLRHVVGREHLQIAPPAQFPELLRSAVIHQQN
ncbi:MAG: hypothetical protein EXR72_09710 [Myxococcales bacterium]|nr:hypothetical protein [Myxococcales bacterium]